MDTRVMDLDVVEEAMDIMNVAGTVDGSDNTNNISDVTDNTTVVRQGKFHRESLFYIYTHQLSWELYKYSFVDTPCCVGILYNYMSFHLFWRFVVISLIISAVHFQKLYMTVHKMRDRYQNIDCHCFSSRSR